MNRRPYVLFINPNKLFMNPTEGDPYPAISLIVACVGLITLIYFLTVEAAYTAFERSQQLCEKLKEKDAKLHEKLQTIFLKGSIAQGGLTLIAAFSALVYAAGSASFILNLELPLQWKAGIAGGLTVLSVSLLLLVPRIGVSSSLSIAKRMVSTMGWTANSLGKPFSPKTSEAETGNEESAKDEEMAEGEKDILSSVLHFGEETVDEIMVPRVDIVDLNVNSPFKEILNTVIENGYSRLPVTDGSRDKVVGILYARDLLPYGQNDGDFEWQKLLRKPYFVPESKMIEDLLREFQRNKIHIAVVVDEYGSTSGIVTMEDILEEIVGEINDEYDEDTKTFVKIDDKNYIFEGKTPIDDFAETLDLDQEKYKEAAGESETLAGFLLELLDEFPTKHQTADFDNLHFEVLTLDKRRISKIKVTLKDPKPEDADN